MKKRGGKKWKRSRKIKIRKGPMILKDESIDSSQLYAKVLKRLGGKPPYLECLCEDGVDRRCVVRGKFIKKVWMNIDDIVLINYNKDNDNLKGEIELKYTPEQVSKLKRSGKLSFISNNLDDDENNIIFGENKQVIEQEHEVIIFDDI